ncbi:MAG: BofC C-terminal domain-containing protein [Oscillospiraceae bacterium]|nr:BofC C-terminal domain-containing protein [Oscillospiraceae bacterium]
MEHTFGITFAALFFVFLSVFGLFAAKDYFSPEEESPAAETAFIEEPEEEKLLLGIFEGKLALFAGESPYPNRIYDFLTRTLPAEDQKRLANGIIIESEEELESLLEDFMS